MLGVALAVLYLAYCALRGHWWPALFHRAVALATGWYIVLGLMAMSIGTIRLSSGTASTSGLLGTHASAMFGSPALATTMLIIGASICILLYGSYLMVRSAEVFAGRWIPFWDPMPFRVQNEREAGRNLQTRNLLKGLLYFGLGIVYIF